MSSAYCNGGAVRPFDADRVWSSWCLQVAEGLIWIWGSGGPSEYIRAAAQRPNVTREIDDLPEGSKVTEVFKTYTRDLPYDWQVRTPCCPASSAACLHLCSP